MLFAWEYLPRPSRTCLVDPCWSFWFFRDMALTRCLPLSSSPLWTSNFSSTVVFASAFEDSVFWCDKKLHKSHEWRLPRQRAELLLRRSWTCWSWDVSSFHTEALLGLRPQSGWLEGLPRPRFHRTWPFQKKSSLGGGWRRPCQTGGWTLPGSCFLGMPAVSSAPDHWKHHRRFPLNHGGRCAGAAHSRSSARTIRLRLCTNLFPNKRLGCASVYSEALLWGSYSRHPKRSPILAHFPSLLPRPRLEWVFQFETSGWTHVHRECAYWPWPRRSFFAQTSDLFHIGIRTRSRRISRHLLEMQLHTTLPTPQSAAADIGMDRDAPLSPMHAKSR